MDPDGNRVCADCRVWQSRLVSISRHGADHGGPHHETVFGFKYVSYCPGCGAGELVAHSHDCWDTSHREPWDMWWIWEMQAPDIDRLRTGLSGCPQWMDYDCRCQAHTSLRRSYDNNWAFDDISTASVRLSRAGYPQLDKGGFPWTQS